MTPRFASILACPLPLAAECATQIGKPGALKFDTANLVAWNIPWDEGEERRRRKEFDRISGESYGIVKEYNISSMTKKDEVGDLHVSVRTAHAALCFQNDLDAAWAWAAKHDAKMKELGKPGFNRPMPRPGKEILK